MKLHVELAFDLHPPVTDVEMFHDLGERLMQELEKLEACNDDVFDPAVSTEADTGTLVVELVCTDTPNAMVAVEKALSVIRTAAHAVGFGTTGWPSLTPEELWPSSMQAGPVDSPVPAGV